MLDMACRCSISKLSDWNEFTLAATYLTTSTKLSDNRLVGASIKEAGSYLWVGLVRQCNLTTLPPCSQAIIIGFVTFALDLMQSQVPLDQIIRCLRFLKLTKKLEEVDFAPREEKWQPQDRLTMMPLPLLYDACFAKSHRMDNCLLEFTVALKNTHIPASIKQQIDPIDELLKTCRDLPQFGYLSSRPMNHA